jgi:ribokinase
MRRPKITVVGSNNIDLVTYIKRMPREGETIVAPRFEMGFGGKGANQAVAAALLGADVSMVTRVGGDMFGPHTRRNFERFGIETSHIESVDGVSSGVAPIFVDENSKNSILIVKGANDCLKPGDIEKAKKRILESDIVIMQLEISLQTVYHAMDLCEAHGVQVILNPAPADPGLELNRIASAAYVIPNELELQSLTGMPTRSLEEVKRAAGALLAKGLSKIIVTLGDKGSLLLADGQELLVPAHAVESRDTTGAGDAFIGCFAVYLVETGSAADAMELASKYAAFSTMKPGTQKSFLDRKSFEAALEKQ